MTPERVAPVLQKALNINVEQLAETAGTNAHNLREEWNAITVKVSEFTTKYAEAGKASS